jgi:hypothetical protein
VTASSGNAEVLNDLLTKGSLKSEYQMPFADISYNIAQGWTWKAAWNFYGYGENSAVGPAFPRDFHGNVFTLSVRNSF